MDIGRTEECGLDIIPVWFLNQIFTLSLANFIADGILSQLPLNIIVGKKNMDHFSNVPVYLGSRYRES